MASRLPCGFHTTLNFTSENYMDDSGDCAKVKGLTDTHDFAGLGRTQTTERHTKMTSGTGDFGVRR